MARATSSARSGATAHTPPAPRDTKITFLDAALAVIRTKGYSATTVDDLCVEAGLTNRAFFHHFKSREALALDAAAHFANRATSLLTHAPYRSVRDPLDRLLGYVDFRKAILTGSLPHYTCLLGTMVQTSETNPAIRAARDTHITDHAALLASDIAEARSRYAPDASWSPESLALHTQAVIQGAFILAKAKGGPEVAADSLDHLRRYLELLFDAKL